MKQNTLRIINSCVVAIVVCGIGIYNIVHRNSHPESISNSVDYQLNIDYQAHPIASFIGSIIPGIIAGFAFYWLSGWRARRKQEKLKQFGDDKFYDEVARELQDKPMIPGLWAKAFSEMGGDDAKARALYIKYRVAQLSEVGHQPFEEQRREDQQRVAIPPRLHPTQTNNHRLHRLLAILFCALSCFFGFCGLMFVVSLFGESASPDGKTDGAVVLFSIVAAAILFSLSLFSGYATKHFLKQTH